MILAAATNGKVHPPTPGEIAQAMTGRDYLSYSQVTTYQACPLQWWYSYVEKAPKEHVSAALLLGSGVHAAIEYHLQAVMAEDPVPSVDELMGVFQQSWKTDAGVLPVQYTGEDDANGQGETARRMIQAYLESPHSKVQGELIGIEEQLRTTLAPDLPDLLAVIDKIEHREGELVLTDHKTARSMWSAGTALEHADQLILYAQAAEAIAGELNAKIKLEFCVITKAKMPKVETITVAYDSDKANRSKAVIRNVFKSMQLGVVYPSPSAMRCPTCSFRKNCDGWHKR